MTRLSEQELQLLDLSTKLFFQRYRLAVVLGHISSGKTKAMQRVGEQVQATYTSLATELLPATVEKSFSPTLGAFGPDDLIEYVLGVSNRTDAKLLIFDQSEPLLATFGRTGVVIFFRMLSQVEPLKPTIFVTYLSKQVEESHFPRERVWIV